MALMIHGVIGASILVECMLLVLASCFVASSLAQSSLQKQID